MKTRGTVLRVDKDYAIVGVKRHTACDTCRADCGGHCDKASTVETKVKNTLSAKIGDEVELFTETARVMRLALLVFVLPLITAALGYLIPYLCGLEASVSAVTTVIFFLATFFFIWIFWRRKDRYEKIEMTRILRSKEND